jgi:hypothetical protein
MAEPLSRAEAAEVLRTAGHAARVRASSSRPGDVASDQQVYARRAAACEAGAAALEQVEVLRIALSAARAWMVEHGLPLTDGHAVVVRGVSWVDMDAALGEVEMPEPPGECPRCAQSDMLMGYPSSGEWVCANCGWQSGVDRPVSRRGGEAS